VESLNLSGLFIYFMSDSPYVFFNGELHSIAYSDNHEFILCFDVDDERFPGIMLPQKNLDSFWTF
jgi:hypothetical protein